MVIFYIGDAKVMDEVDAHYGGYKVTRLSRYCDISSAHADKLDHACHQFTIDNVKPHMLTMFNDESSTTDTKHAHKCLEYLSTHQCINSLWDVNMNGQSVLPLPNDLMHIMSTMIISSTMWPILILNPPRGLLNWGVYD